jgi:glycosyltransferase involved in cell wall biosynthesis
MNDGRAITMCGDALRVLIVAENVSERSGGEAGRPFHYFRVLRSRGVETWLVTHARCREELLAAFPRDAERIHFVPDTLLLRTLWRSGKMLPMAMRRFTTGSLMHLTTQLMERRVVRHLVSQLHIDVVHEPIPISPREPSLMFNVGAPIVIGPLNGNMAYPPAFRHRESCLVRPCLLLGRACANLLHRIIPGKRLAATVLVANNRTREALPVGCRGHVEEFGASGVDISVWRPPERCARAANGAVWFAYLGRLIGLKGVDLLLEAFKPVAETVNAKLQIMGDGPCRQELEAMSKRLGLADHVVFSGWLSPAESSSRLRSTDVFVMPSLHDAGATVVSEAMAAGLPVIATRWGGQADSVDADSGILVEPKSREALIAGLSEAMLTLAQSRELRERVGHAARRRAVECFDWERRVDQLLKIYLETVQRSKGSRAAIVS